MTRGMKCHRIQRVLPGYLDDSLPVGWRRVSHSDVREHLEDCHACRSQLERYQKLLRLIGGSQRATAPDDLAVRIRIAAAKAREDSGYSHRLRRLRDRAQLILENALRPLALPATGGLLAAVMVFTMVLPFYARVGPLSNASDDLPLALYEPARLEALAGFSVSALGDNHSGSGVILVEATVGVDGDITDYRILEGPDNEAVRRQLDQILIFSRFRPAMSFHRPMAGGRVVLSFSAVNVKG